MGNKVAAREQMKKIDVPIVPGTEGGITDFEQAKKAAWELGYPLLVKPSAGGGGIGMIIANNENELRAGR